MTLEHHPKDNELLAALPDAEWQRWRPQLERVQMPLGEVLYESGGTLKHVYFPTTAIVSLLYVMENGAIRFSGLPADLLGSDDLRRAYLGV